MRSKLPNKFWREELIEDRERQFRVAESAARLGSWEWDPVSGTSFLSPELHKIFGTEGLSNHSEEWARRVHPDDWPYVQKQMALAASDRNMEFEYRYQHPQHGMRWLYCKGSGSSPGHARISGIVLDITERKQVEEVRSRLAAIVESSHDAIISKDLRGIVTTWNLAAERLFGYSEAEMLGKPIMLIIPPHLKDEEASILQRIKAGERIDEYETVRIHKDGRQISVSLTISPIRNSRGDIVGASKIARDISERIHSDLLLKQAYSHLEQHVKERTADLERAEQELRALSTRLLQAQDEERRRIARELHDGAGQILAGLNMSLVPLQQKLEILEPKLAKAAGDSVSLVDELTRELRTMSHLLHPPMLDESGLGYALSGLLRDFRTAAILRPTSNWILNWGDCPEKLKLRFFGSSKSV